MWQYIPWNMDVVCCALFWFSYINSSPPGQNGRHFADDVFGCIFVNEKFCILTKISLKCVSKGQIDDNPALVKIMAWRRINAIIWSSADPIHWHIYAALGGDKLRVPCGFMWYIHPYPSGLLHWHGAIIWLPQCQCSNPEGYRYNLPVPSHTRTCETMKWKQNSWHILCIVPLPVVPEINGTQKQTQFLPDSHLCCLLLICW